MPRSPVAALAQPLLATTACAVAPLRCLRVITTGAATTLHCVYTPAAVQGASEYSNATSSLSQSGRMRARTAPATNPRALVTPPSGTTSVPSLMAASEYTTSPPTGRSLRVNRWDVQAGRLRQPQHRVHVLDRLARRPL